MPDELDRIQEHGQLILDRKIAAVSSAARTGKHAPFCRVCGDDIPPARQSDICVDCLSDIERKQKRR